MKTLFAMVVVLLAALGSAQAHPARVRMLVHGSHDFTHEVGWSLHFIPGPNLVAGVAPVAYLQFDYHAETGITISPTIGSAFKNNALIVALRVTPVFGAFSGWLDYEAQPQTGNHYWFAQAQYRLQNCVLVGLEEESWGNNRAGYSHGGGPNILLRTGSSGVGADVAFHIRSLSGVVGPELFFRFHIFTM